MQEESFLDLIKNHNMNSFESDLCVKIKAVKVGFIENKLHVLFDPKRTSKTSIERWESYGWFLHEGET